MKKERIVLSFIAVLLGLLVAGVAFYFYQSTKAIPPSTIDKISIKPTKTPVRAATKTPGYFLTLDEPKDELVVSKKIIKVSGKTAKGTIIVISTNSNDEVIEPTATGNFSTTMNIEDGQNQIMVTAIYPNGEEENLVRTISFSEENF